MKPQQKIFFLSKFCLGYCIRVYLGFPEKLNEIDMLLLLEFIQFLQQLHDPFNIVTITILLCVQEVVTHFM